MSMLLRSSSSRRIFSSSSLLSESLSRACSLWKFCNAAVSSASYFLLMFFNFISRRIPATSIRIRMLSCRSSSGWRYSGARPARTSSSLASI
uniref:Uncharacterized protein n=1 Tax=Ixodes ricinus TaxID=34613 RepID=A0A6B0UC45_IXORI